MNKRKKTLASPLGRSEGRKEGSGAIARFKLGRATNLQRQGGGREGEREGEREMGKGGRERERGREVGKGEREREGSGRERRSKSGRTREQRREEEHEKERETEREGERREKEMETKRGREEGGRERRGDKRERGQMRLGWSLVFGSVNFEEFGGSLVITMFCTIYGLQSDKLKFNQFGETTSYPTFSQMLPSSTLP